MATKNPRITITLKPSVHAVLRRLSGLTERSQSALVGELLEQSEPVFERMVKVLEAARAASDQLRETMADSLERGQARMEAQLGLMLEDMDTSVQPILEASEAVARRSGRAPRGAGPDRRAGAGGQLTPVPVTRGSGSTSAGRVGVSTGVRKGSKKGGNRGRV